MGRKYTIKDLANTLHVSHTRVYQVLKREHVAKDQHGQYIITDELAHTLAKKYTKHSSKEYAKVEPPRELNEVLATLESQLQQKDKEINYLHRLLDQQQQLSLANDRLLGIKTEPGKTGQEKTKTQQKANQSPSDENADKEPDQQGQTKQPTGKHRGFFSRLFNR